MAACKVRASMSPTTTVPARIRVRDSEDRTQVSRPRHSWRKVPEGRARRARREARAHREFVSDEQRRQPRCRESCSRPMRSGR